MPTIFAMNHAIVSSLYSSCTFNILKIYIAPLAPPPFLHPFPKVAVLHGRGNGEVLMLRIGRRQHHHLRSLNACRVVLAAGLATKPR